VEAWNRPTPAAYWEWSFRYRFQTVVGKAVFPIRAIVRREAGYPYERGTSRTIRVTVIGR
jgi:hypothetical protein